MSARTAAFLLTALALAACEPEDPGTPVAADALCGEIAAIVCGSDTACFPGSTPDDCVETQAARCDEIVQPLVDDPRLAYDPLRAGAFVESLRAQGDACWEAPFDYASFLDVFAGTGALGADCTPARLDAISLRVSSLSCADRAACRLHLRADGSTVGVCEARRDDACSHALDCEADEFCSLPARWQPGVWGECRPLRADGWSCASDLECASRHCEGTCTARPALARPLEVPYSELVLGAEPIAYLRFAESGARFTDSSGHGHAGEVMGGAMRASQGAIEDDTSGALQLGGEGQFVRVAGLDELEDAEGLSLECWFRRDDVTESRPLLDLSDAMGFGPHVWNHDRGDKVFANFVDGADAQHPIMSGEGAITASTWHHVVATFDGAMGRLYLDGARVGEVMLPAPAEEGDPVLHVTDTLYVGHRVAMGEQAARSFAGVIDEVAVYDHALDEPTIRRHHDAGVAGAIENELPLYTWLAP
ncbi:LamG domain-containing protein [Sandaracinus amylolyticus]|uniref:LamG-like jellyroll fold domain-containing protein n=1 Tax=Sandaracinus amylolyticus TaxID=927083 RepID=A0A0F6W8E9_9BACT|nr:LamG domain-containing protein [Sandaracinus amylolyticus]AKF09952.1 hypothetical protein DB32_007101 [Sandaracinus amylolyticus]